MFDRVFRHDLNPAGLSWEEFVTGNDRAAVSTSIPGICDRDLWQRMIDQKRPSALIVAPHATRHPDLAPLFDTYWSAMPQDWDIVCMGAFYPAPPMHIGGHVFRPARFGQIHGYAIRDRAAAKLVSQHSPGSLEDRFDSLARDGSMNIYAIWPNLVCPRGPGGEAEDSFNSFHQLGQHGRMGNQFFQVAATIGAAVRHGYRPQFAAWHSSQIMLESFDQNLDVSRITRFHQEPQFHYSEIPHSPNLDLTGFFQSPLYFQGYEDLIRQYLRPSLKLQAAISTRFPRLLARPTVALHVRRCDYVGMTHAFELLPIEYYRAAMRFFEPGHQFAIFSDDPEWCRTAFRDDLVEIISGNPGYADLYLMAACRHQVIANSSFSWWAAWLNADPGKKVIAPGRWFGPALAQNDTRDLLPSQWIRLDP